MFRYCSATGYKTLDLRGDAGLDGANGANGKNGTAGTNGADGTSCSVTAGDGTSTILQDGTTCDIATELDSSYTVTCGNTSISLRNGVDGQDGQDGASCTGSLVNSDIQITCGGVIVGTLNNGTDGYNGKDGVNGFNGLNGTSCSGTVLDNGAILISCGGVVVDTLQDGATGADGQSGINGTDGLDGTSCTGSVVSGGIEITCAGVVVGTLTNGADGQDGNDGLNGSDGATGSQGDAGASCTVSDDGFGTLTQTCGATSVSWPKAVCGTKSYDPASGIYCSNNQLVMQDERDGNEYQVVLLGTQYWFAQNLAYLPSVMIPTDNAPNSPRYYVANYNGTDVTSAKAHANYAKYGVLYNKPASTTACPTNWHSADQNDWGTMLQVAGMSQSEVGEYGMNVASSKLMAHKLRTGIWLDGLTSLNSFGMNIQPAGYLEAATNNFIVVDQATQFQAGTDLWGIFTSYEGLQHWGNTFDNYGYSVRCVKD